jgi:zinc protease
MTAHLPRFLLVALLFLASAAGAADLPKKVVSIEGVTEYRLDNGLRLLTVPDRSADTVGVYIVYMVGSRHESYGEKGMAHLLEHLLFKGTPRHANPKAALNARGARYNGTTSFDRTNYFETLTASDENLDFALGLEADRMVNSFVSKADLDSEMTVVRNEFESGENNPGSVLMKRMQQAAFPWHNYGRSVIGARSDIESVPIERLQAFYRTWYRPDNAVLIVSGKFEETRALELVTRHFGPIPRPRAPIPALYTVEPVQDGERTVTLRRTGDTPIVATLYRLPAGSHPDYAAIDVLVRVLGTAPAGRLHRALVQKGLATGAWGWEASLHDPGYASFGASLAKDASMDATRDVLVATVENVAAEPIRADEVERARTLLLNEMEKALTDAPTLVRNLGEYSAMGDWRLFFIYRDRLKAVTIADVQRVAAQYLKPANRVLGTFVPTAQPDRAEIPATPDLGAAIAAYKGTEAADLGEAFDPTPQNIEARLVRRTLANGIRVALLPKKTRGANVIVSMSLHWGDEASKSNRGTSCSFASSMLMRGTQKRSRADLRDAFDRLKANASVSADSASVETRRENLEASLRLIAEVLRQPAFPESEFEELRRAQISGTEGQRSDPSAIASENLSRHINPYPRGHWLYAYTLEERLEEFKRVTRESAERCYRDLVGATGADFVAVGDFDPEALMKLVEELFGDWKNPAPYTRIATRHFEQPAVAREFRTPDKANAVLRGGAAVRMRDDHPDFPALILGNYMLGGTSAGRLALRVREKEGLSYSTYSSFSANALDETSLFSIASIFAPQNKERVERALREEISRALAEGFSAEEVETAKKGFLESRRVSRSQDRALAGRLNYYLFLGRTFAWDIDFEKRIAALTPAEILAAMKRHLDPARITIMKAGDFR